ncbi:type II toxin-antitoxin system RelB/DinJ family antitoxin [Lactiplantibacillus plantarum]|uniref:type II toxin-antitoxin system RelB/DinJ family antitoxin n=2 Tax=Lactiplantibacillus plantarum TaxID=1590 RepID=UPI002ADEC4FA|nr:hypothetical protein [Lactiplantibacillus plantarum]
MLITTIGTSHCAECRSYRCFSQIYLDGIDEEKLDLVRMMINLIVVSTTYVSGWLLSTNSIGGIQMVSNNNDKTMFAMRINKAEKDQLKLLYKDMGLDLSTAVNLFFKQSLLENGLPFRPTRATDSNAERK